MKFGLTVIPQHPPEESMVQRLQEIVELVHLAREAGFDLITTGQHYLSTPYQMLQSMPFLARLAPEALPMQVAAAIILLPLQNPVDMAEQVATLDIICQGRFIFGVGLGYRDEEYDAFGVKHEDRVTRFEECLQVMKLLWTQEEVSYRGRYFEVPRVRSTCRPVQRPHPPIWVAANNDAAVRRAARLGHPWLMNPHATLGTLQRQMGAYREAAREAGFTPPTDVPLMRELYIGKTYERAVAEATPYLRGKYQAYASWGQDRVLPGTEDFNIPFEELARDRFILGSPEECVQAIHQCREATGATHLVLRLNWPGMPHHLAMREIELLGEQVIPQFE